MFRRDTSAVHFGKHYFEHHDKVHPGSAWYSEMPTSNYSNPAVPRTIFASKGRILSTETICDVTSHIFKTFVALTGFSRACDTGTFGDLDFSQYILLLFKRSQVLIQVTF